MISGQPSSSELPRSASWIWFATSGSGPTPAGSNVNSLTSSEVPIFARERTVAGRLCRGCARPALPRSRDKMSDSAQSRRKRGHSVPDAGVQRGAQTMPENTHARSNVHCRSSGSLIEIRARPRLPLMGPPEPSDEGRYTHIVSHDDRPLHRVMAVFVHLASKCRIGRRSRTWLVGSQIWASNTPRH